MSITCCRCHNHPLEKWTQDQYWSMANLFAASALKNGDRGRRGAGAVDAVRRRAAPAPRHCRCRRRRSTASRCRSTAPSIAEPYFADWLTAPDNPYFARALVNRVWRNFLGRGLVEAEDDLRQTNPPTNAELFDALAKDFVAHKYDVKQLIRTIMNSATYQRSSRPLPENETDDRFYSHYLIRRLPAEVILDAYSQVTGVPTPFKEVSLGATGGTAGTNAYPPGTRPLQLPDTLVVSQFLDSFGRPERGADLLVRTAAGFQRRPGAARQQRQTLNDKLRGAGLSRRRMVKRESRR